MAINRSLGMEANRSIMCQEAAQHVRLVGAMEVENIGLYAYYRKVPGYGKGEKYGDIGPRTYYDPGRRSLMWPHDWYATLSMTWDDYWSQGFKPKY